MGIEDLPLLGRHNCGEEIETHGGKKVKLNSFNKRYAEIAEVTYDDGRSIYKEIFYVYGKFLAPTFEPEHDEEGIVVRRRIKEAGRSKAYEENKCELLLLHCWERSIRSYKTLEKNTPKCKKS